MILNKIQNLITELKNTSKDGTIRSEKSPTTKEKNLEYIKTWKDLKY